ncbi:MAG: hypothetical protein F6K25_28990 [Okeania sp. SIO2G4]|uniref:hypothetical protein n=1 Tax=unclassified Okeania TaxID=2634635 RepID=UPI0013B66DBE|nr:MULTISPECIES: hypothetical protein [unclassified Okeania]NEP73782.1 hypothetical protein [Okeania sp. SIO2G5]NEP94440.1 hypothetical protein [Okeania sp. SIO2F5]NEQ94469.1 hypothetical protein [Okeania sp. SIO2G4]
MKKILSNTVFTTIASASTALLASSAYLFAPPSASAFELVRGDDGAVESILDLEVDGEFFNVEFLFGTYNDIYDGTFDFFGGASASSAASAIVHVLGDSEFIGFTWGAPLTASLYLLSFSILATW